MTDHYIVEYPSLDTRGTSLPSASTMYFPDSSFCFSSSFFFSYCSIFLASLARFQDFFLDIIYN